MTQIHEQIPCENIYYIRLKRKLTSLSSINTALDQLASQYEQELLPPPQSGGSALWAKFPYHPSPRALHSRLFPFSRAAFLPRQSPRPFLLSHQALLLTPNLKYTRQQHLVRSTAQLPGHFRQHLL